MVVGDDVALGIDDEAGAERLAHLVVVAAVALIGNLAAEELVEEVLEVALTLALTLLLIVATLAVVAAGSLLMGIDGPAAAVGAVAGSWIAWAGSGC